MNPRTKLAKFRKAEGLSQSALARELGCHPSFVQKVEDGQRTLVGVLAFRLEDLTEGWDGGPIRAREWAEPVWNP